MQPPSHLETLSRLSGRLAHDVSNYLYVVHSAAEVLSRLPDLHPRGRAVVEMLQRNTAETGELVDALLAFSGSKPLRPERLDLAAFGAGLAAPLRQTLGEAIALETAFEPDCWPVYCDRAALEGALLELAANARGAMPGGGRFAVRACNADEEVSISVTDTGSGMTPEVKARAFDPLFTTKSGLPGQGWGLSRVYGFIRQCDGRIELESEPGAGTTVKLLLPRMRRPSADERSAAQLDDLQVLLIEDEALISMLTEDLLGQLGCRVVGSASSVEQAIAMAERDDIDLALLDLNLRGEPAYPVADALRARGVPFVFVSAYGEAERPWRGRPMVHKPIKLEHLRRAMQRALGAA